MASNKPRLMFVMAQRASITLDKVEMNPDAFATLVAFRSHVLRDHVCGMFTDVPDLRAKAEKARRKYRT